MATRKKILIGFGTRPEALKFAPLIKALDASSAFDCRVCITGQHREMLDQVMKFFRLRVDADLNLMQKNQTLAYISGQVIAKFGEILRQMKPDLVIVQGDTATALMAGIAAFYARVPVAHLEAGLRTGNKSEPFPEEMNRKLLAHIADLHFTPTPAATANLLKEGIPSKLIHEIGNTIVDTVKLSRKNLKKSYRIFKGIDFTKKIIFVTAHRRESFGQGLLNIFQALRRLAEQVSGIEIVYPVHLNPNVSEPAHRVLGSRAGIHLLRPLSYEETCWILEKCKLVLTDSGGIQEEAPSFSKPVLVLRSVTERGEGILAGCAKLVGTDPDKIFRETQALLNSTERYKRMQVRRNPYGDGQSCRRILNILKREMPCLVFRGQTTPKAARKIRRRSPAS